MRLMLCTIPRLCFFPAPIGSKRLTAPMLETPSPATKANPVALADRAGCSEPGGRAEVGAAPAGSDPLALSRKPADRRSGREQRPQGRPHGAPTRHARFCHE